MRFNFSRCQLEVRFDQIVHLFESGVRLALGLQQPVLHVAHHLVNRIVLLLFLARQSQLKLVNRPAAHSESLDGVEQDISHRLDRLLHGCRDVHPLFRFYRLEANLGSP